MDNHMKIFKIAAFIIGIFAANTMAYAQNTQGLITPTPSVISPTTTAITNPDNIIFLTIDNFMINARKNCDFNTEFPKVIRDFVEGKEESAICRDFYYRYLRYANKIKTTDMEKKCEATQNQTIEQCEINRRQCKLAAYDIRNFYDNCRKVLVRLSVPK